MSDQVGGAYPSKPPHRGTLSPDPFAQKFLLRSASGTRPKTAAVSPFHDPATIGLQGPVGSFWQSRGVTIIPPGRSLLRGHSHGLGCVSVTIEAFDRRARSGRVSVPPSTVPHSNSSFRILWNGESRAVIKVTARFFSAALR